MTDISTYDPPTLGVKKDSLGSENNNDRLYHYYRTIFSDPAHTTLVK